MTFLLKLLLRWFKKEFVNKTKQYRIDNEPSFRYKEGSEEVHRIHHEGRRQVQRVCDQSGVIEDQGGPVVNDSAGF